MKQYLQLVQDILDHGSWQNNRTGIRTLSMPGASLRFDLQQGFPAVTTKKLAFKSAIGEMVGFMRASRSAAEFRALGCKVWDQNANENKAWLANPYRLQEDDLGPVYGVQWRQWPAYKLIDLAQPQGPAQIADALAKGYRQIGEVDEGGVPHAVLYKAVDQLRQGLDTLKVGDISDILETPDAFYVARIEEQRAAYQPTLEELRPELEKDVRRAEADRLYQAWMERLKRKHAIKIF